MGHASRQFLIRLVGVVTVTFLLVHWLRTSSEAYHEILISRLAQSNPQILDFVTGREVLRVFESFPTTLFDEYDIWGYDTTAPLWSQYGEFLATRLGSEPILVILAVATLLGVVAYVIECRRGATGWFVSRCRSLYRSSPLT